MTPARVTRRRRLKVLLALAAVFSLVGLLGVQRHDDAWLLTVAAQPLDAWGTLRSAGTNALRDCREVQGLDLAAPQARDALAALRSFSPPDSDSAQLLKADRLGSWLAVQASFDSLEPVVVLMRLSAGSVEVVPQGVWSGPTPPWNAAWRIRRFLGERVPAAPVALLRCLDPEPVFTGPPRPPAPGRSGT